MSWNNRMRSDLREHLSLYVFVAVLLVMGIVFGALMVNALSAEQKEELGRHLGSFVQMIDQGAEIGGKASLQATFLIHLKWLLLIWLLGLSIIGLPFIFLLDFLKGVLLGFSVGVLVGEMSWKGMLFALVSVAPQNMIIIPALMICSVSAVSFSLYLIKNRFLQKKGALYPPFVRFSSVTLSMIVLLFGVSLFEAYLSPSLMQWVTPMLTALAE
ncbi:stage II sporulation protein M [Paenibacillus koleovorans]|uniref:stage II sporulation protein M n=1 Tax=Paenibacillus koleovorans TaxID=121608 RepID=UPI000FDB5690|nr:stage II sporulation protein M [Paenibacillus koleovorans]